MTSIGEGGWPSLSSPGTKTMGAPLFAFFAKGGDHGRLRRVRVGGRKGRRSAWSKGRNIAPFILDQNDGPLIPSSCGSACGPVIVPVFKTGDRYLAIAMMGSTPIRFRQHLGFLARGAR